MSTIISNPQQEAKEYQSRYKILYYILAISMTIIFLRLWYLQIISGQELRDYSDKNRIKGTIIPAPRGLILDREERILVENLPGYVVTISPQYAKKLEDTAKAIAPILKMNSKKIISRVKKGRRLNGPFRDVRIKENLTTDEIFKIKQLRLDHPGLDIAQITLRHYPMNEIGAQLFGYVGEISKEQIDRYNKKYKNQIHFKQGDIIGKSGLEEVWETKIRGEEGIQFVEVDARGRKTYTPRPAPFSLKHQQPQPGHSLVLTIDKDIQKAAHQAMMRNDKIKNRIGNVVAMKSNGEILAWVVTPSFNPNQFSHGISKNLWSKLINDPFKPLRNKVIQDHYSPGSTFKPFVALAALQESVITARTKIFSPGSMVYGRRTYHDARRTGHGNINVIEAIERSSNVFFYKMGTHLGIDKIAKYGRLFGLGEKTNIKLSNEEPGLMPTKAWKLKSKGEEWQPGEDLSNAIGQGFVLTTAIQLTHSFNTLAMEGQHYRPFLVKKLINSNNEEVTINKPEIINDLTQPNEEGVFIKRQHFKTVKKGLGRVFSGENGTARWYQVKGLDMAGKTGTVQLISFSAQELYKKCQERPINLRHHGWFVGFAPTSQPEITVAVFTEHGCSGSGGAAPVFRDIVRAYFEKYHPDQLPKRKTKAKTPPGPPKKVPIHTETEEKPLKTKPMEIES